MLDAAYTNSFPVAQRVLHEQKLRHLPTSIAFRFAVNNLYPPLSPASKRFNSSGESSIPNPTAFREPPKTTPFSPASKLFYKCAIENQTPLNLQTTDSLAKPHRHSLG